MKKFFTNKILLLSILSVVAMAAGTALKNGSGAPGSYTNAPGESNCTTSGCHTGSLNPVSSNLNNLTLTGTFTGGGYIPDSTYTMTLTYSQSGINRFGMELTALTKTGSNPAGTLTAGSGSHKLTGTVAGKTRQYLTHNAASSSGSRTWVFTWQAPSTNVDTIIFYVVVNAANSDGNSTGDQIYAKEFKFGSSSLLPKATINANKTTICAGDQIQFSGSGTNSPTSYQWKFNGGAPSTSSSQNVNVTFSSPGTFYDTLRVFNAKGSSAPEVIKITVNSKPIAVIVSTVPGTTICAGDTVTLTAAFGSTYKYSWNTGNPADTLQTLKVTQNGNYEVTITAPGGCSSTSAPVNITVKPKPTISLSSSATNDSTCASDSVTFTATAPGGSTINFYKNSVSQQTGTSTTFKTLLAPGDVITADATDNGCTSNLATKNITVVQPAVGPVLSCGTSTTSSVIFNWTAISGATGYEVSTDTGKTWAAPSTGSTGLSHTISGLGFSTTQAIWVRGLDNSLCGKTLTTNTTCATLSCSGVTYQTTLGDTLLCPGDSTTITISNISTGSFSIKFNNGAYVIDTVFWVLPSSTTDYPFEIIDSTKLNCGAAPFSVNVKVDIVPSVTTVASPGNTVCFGQTVNISTTATGFAKYTIFANGSPSTLNNTTGIFTGVSVNDGDKVAIQGETPAGCTTLSNEIDFTVNPLPIPGFTSTVNNKSVDFDDTTSTSVIHSWSFGDGGLSMQKAPSHTYSSVGTFNVKLIAIDANGCVDSITKQITTTNVSVGEIDGLNGWDVYPNPTTGNLQLDINWQGEGVLKIKVTDITGKTVLTNEVADKGLLKHNLNLRHLPDGTYLLHLQAEGGEKILKVLKQDK